MTQEDSKEMTKTGLIVGPLSVAAHQPLRVAAYARIADAIRGGILRPGELLPSEADLGAAMGVSRTVVREALMLLAEDGLVISKRGIGRLVAPSLPVIGLERLRTFEEVLAGPDGPARVVAHEHGAQVATDFIRRGLGLGSPSASWFRESLAYRGSTPVAIVQEHIPAGRDLEDISGVLAASADSYGDREGSLLAAMIADAGPVFTSGQCEITTGPSGQIRGDLLGLEDDAPVLILVQSAKIGSRGAYLAKCIASPEAGRFVVVQT
jgi:GntR family transcriptional regulator